MSDWKKTLLMPQTMFEMRGNLRIKEPIFQAKWKQKRLWKQILKKNYQGKYFVLHDGPIYANGDIHVGHALNRILKDIIVRHKSLQGYYAPFLLGWDTHGLPIETAITKIKSSWKDSDPLIFRQKCYEYVSEQIQNQQTQFSVLGLLSINDDYYATYNSKYEGYQIDFLTMLFKQKLIYRSLKPVYWSPSSQSALAESEVEYQEKTSPSVYVACNLKDGKNILDEETKLVIWTTTPWTLTANQFIAVGENLEYVTISCQQGKFLLGKDLLDDIIVQCNLTDVTILNTYLGKDLLTITYYHPLNKNIINSVVIGHHITTTSGTSLVHTACGFGIDDFIIGKENNTKALVNIDDAGYFNDLVNDNELKGMFYEDANKIITQRLELAGMLLSLKFIRHSYPHDWRTKKPIIYRATEQWFINIQKIKPQLLKQIKKINFFPAWGQERMYQMISNRDDWCISRQRLWGVPITIIYGEDGKPIIDCDLIQHFANLIRKHGSDIWWSWTLEKLLPKGYFHKSSPNGNFRKETDIMDVWFDSGISHWNLWKEYQWTYPVDIYFEGIDQFRGWFNSSLITGMISPKKQVPCKTIISHGFITDEKGRKMSKSLGNVINPLDVCQEYGADILRLWVSSVDYSDEIKIGSDILKQVSETYRKIRNVLRFILGNLFDFNPEKHLVKKLNNINSYFLLKTEEYYQSTQSAYNEYNFNQVYAITNNFIVNVLSSFYFDFTKDILYLEAKNSDSRKQVQTVMYYMLQTLLFNLAPILIHTCEEVYDNLPWKAKLSSVHLMDSIKFPKITNSKELLAFGDKIWQLRQDVNKALEKAREDKIILGASLQAKVLLELNPEYISLKNVANLSQILIVSEVSFVSGLSSHNAYQSANIVIELKSGDKCQRCWLIKENLQNNFCCLRCTNVIKNLKEKNHAKFNKKL